MNYWSLFKAKGSSLVLVVISYVILLPKEIFIFVILFNSVLSFAVSESRVYIKFAASLSDDALPFFTDTLLLIKLF